MNEKRSAAVRTLRCNQPATWLCIALMIFMTVGIEALHPLFHCSEMADCGSLCESRPEAERYIQAESNCECPICQSPYQFKTPHLNGNAVASQRICETNLLFPIRDFISPFSILLPGPRAPPA